jgi:bifunctional non-homologous end joining protein LigD
VLKSWAVPKGPSLDPADKRLAVHVEDHPIEYGGFEGVIPQGQYGGGKVIVWDRGTWTPAGDPDAGYRKGHLKFRLDGVKLHGTWNLVRMDEKNWLLIKEKDEAAATEDITRSRPESVLGAEGPPRVWESDRGVAAEPARRRPRSRAPMPEIAEPQLATLVDEAPDGDHWIHEIKFDGYRVICRINGPDVRLSTRRGNDWTASFPNLARAARQLRARDAIIDGEVVVLDARGLSNFQSLQNALGRGREKDVVYCAFDLLYLDGRDLRGLPLTERKALLAQLLEHAPTSIRYTDHVEGNGPTFFKQACELSLEGIVSKRSDAPYRSGRTRDWLKVKCLNRQEFVIAGFTDPEGGRSGFGALVLGVHEKDGRLRHIGKVGTGFTEATLEDLHARLRKLERTSPPFDRPPTGRAARGVHWVEPTLVAEVAFSGWTDDGILRHPRFEGLREDKPPAEVVLERPRAESIVARSSGDRRHEAYPPGTDPLSGRGNHEARPGSLLRKDRGLGSASPDQPSAEPGPLSRRIGQAVLLPEACPPGDARGPAPRPDQGGDRHGRGRRNLSLHRRSSGPDRAGPDGRAGSPSLGLPRRQAGEAGPDDDRSRPRARCPLVADDRDGGSRCGDAFESWDWRAS